MIQPPKFDIVAGFSETQRAQAAALYWQAFEGKLSKLLGPPARGRAFFEDTLDPAFALCAVDEGGLLLGLAGFKTAKGALTGGGSGSVFRHYGLSALWRLPFLAMLERDLEGGVLLMDGICVAPQARGLGLGTALLRAIKDEARRRQMAFVRLDVIDTNPRAEALYLREGFVSLRTETLPAPLRAMFGFSSAQKMQYAVAQNDLSPQRSELTRT